MDNFNSIKWPEITKKQLEKINSVFNVYLFYRQISSFEKEVTCTGCGETYTVSWDDYQIYTASHNEENIRCPKCGAIGTAKSIGKAKDRKNLYEERRVVFLTRKSQNKVILQCYECWKDYWSLAPRYEEVSRYILTPGKAEKYEKGWYSGFYKSGTAKEPFQIKPTIWYAKYPPDNSYTVFGLEKLLNTYLKYNMLYEYLKVERYHNRKNRDYFEHIVTYLCRFSEYPQVEMLQKIGHNDFVYDLVKNGIKNRCNYKKKSPAEFFRVSKEEYRFFNKYKEYGTLILNYYQRLKKIRTKKPMEEAVRCLFEYKIDSIYRLESIIGVCETYDIDFQTEIKYLNRVLPKEDDIYQKYIFHKDYLVAAKEIKLELSVHNVKFPKDLERAHDLAYETREKLRAEIEAEKNREKEKAAKEILKKYDKQYAYSDGQYVIIVPHTVGEIVKEGKNMHHCVGGYAGRHLEGKLTICFLRSVSEPDKSLYTIEMHGTRLQQVQGYHNFTPLTESAQAFFDIWLEWVEHGSPRDKKGQPILNLFERKGA